MPDPEIISDNPDTVIVRETPTPQVVQTTQTRTVTVQTAGGRGPIGVGEKGEKGDKGDPGLSVVDPSLTSYVHVQVPVAADWPIVHNLGFHPNVFAFDSADSPVEGEIEHVDSNSLVLHFTSAFAGGAYLS